MRPTAIKTTGPPTGPEISVVGDTYRIVVGGEQTAGGYALKCASRPAAAPGRTRTPKFMRHFTCWTAR